MSFNIGDIVKIRDNIGMIVGAENEQHIVAIFHNTLVAAENELTALEETIQSVDTATSSAPSASSLVSAPVFTPTPVTPFQGTIPTTGNDITAQNQG